MAGCANTVLGHWFGFVGSNNFLRLKSLLVETIRYFCPSWVPGGYSFNDWQTHSQLLNFNFTFNSLVLIDCRATSSATFYNVSPLTKVIETFSVSETTGCSRPTSVLCVCEREWAIEIERERGYKEDTRCSWGNDARELKEIERVCLREKEREREGGSRSRFIHERLCAK